jgi:hypothetical protein
MQRGIFWSVTKNWRTQVLHAWTPQQLNGTALWLEALKGRTQIWHSVIFAGGMVRYF